jgi:hypothetical protein
MIRWRLPTATSGAASARTGKNMELVPESFVVPENLELQNFRIRKLAFTDVELDYKAVMSSVEIIRKTRGGDWPTSELTFEDDQIDLAWHQREFERRTSFAYTVMSLDEKECLGCLYLSPSGSRSEMTKDADVDVSFWVTQTAYDNGLYAVLFSTIKQWLATWPFRKIAYSNAILP